MPPEEPRQPTVFVVEDEPDDRDALVFHLMATGHRVQAYGAAEPFLAALDPTTWGCLVSDVRLPGLDGLALIAELARRGSQPSRHGRHRICRRAAWRCGR